MGNYQNSVTINVYTDGLTGHANVTFNLQRGGITIGANQSYGVGWYQIENNITNRPVVSATYSVSSLDFQRAYEYATSLVGTTYSYGIFNGQLVCTDFASVIYGMTRSASMPKECGALFTDEEVKNIYEANIVDYFIPGLKNLYDYPTISDTECFPAGTPVTLPDGSTLPIEQIAPDNIVAAFAERGVDGASAVDAPLGVGRVARLYNNVTQEWIELAWTDPQTGERQTLTATPGHVMLTPEGQWKQLAEMVESPSAGPFDGLEADPSRLAVRRAA